MSAKKKYCTIFNFVQLIHKACLILSTFISYCHHLPHINSKHSQPLPCHSTTYHHRVASIALDIQQFLKPFTITSGEMHCHSVVIHTE